MFSLPENSTCYLPIHLSTLSLPHRIYTSIRGKLCLHTLFYIVYFLLKYYFIVNSVFIIFPSCTGLFLMISRLFFFLKSLSLLPCMHPLAKNVFVKPEVKTLQLHFVCQNGYSGIVCMLIQFGADPNIKKHNEWTPLMIATQKSHYDALALLLRTAES